MHSRTLVALASILFVFAGCTTEAASEGGAAPPAAAPPPTAAAHGTFHFLVERNGAPKEVERIVYTDRFTTRLEGAAPGSDVTIVAHLYSPGVPGRGWTSNVTFTADAKGVVDTATMAPLRGTYSGVDPDGLFWSMAEGPLAEGLGINRKAAFFTASVGDVVIAQGALGRTATADSVKIDPVTEDGLVGEYFLPAGAVDRVPVVAFGGSEGGIYGGESYAMRMASLGHPALALAYFGTKGVPDDLTEVPLEYFAKAFAWLDKQPETRKGKVVVIGGSRGGELALQLGATFPNVIGVIAETPSSFRWSSLSSAAKAAWSFEGKPLAYVPSGSDAAPPTVDGPDGAVAWVLRPTFEQSLAKAKPGDLEAARIAVEKTQGSILILAGSDDQMWPACDFGARAMARLTQAGHVAKYGDEAVCFPDAGHAVSGVGLPTAASMWAEIGSEVYSLGGTAAGNARAGRGGDDKIRAFLGRVTR